MNNQLIKTICCLPAAFLVLIAIIGTAAADPSLVPERRRSQFQKEPAYVAVPYVYDFPGIGSGVGVLGAAANIFKGVVFCNFPPPSVRAKFNRGYHLSSLKVRIRTILLYQGQGE